MNSFRAALLRPTNSRGQPPVELAPKDVGITPYYEPTKNPILGLSVAGGFSIGGQGGNVAGLTNATRIQVSDDLSWVKGSHQPGFGVNNIYSKLSVTGWTSSDGVFSFNATNTGLGLGDFMPGDVNAFMQRGVQAIGFRSDLHRSVRAGYLEGQLAVYIERWLALGSLPAIYLGRRPELLFHAQRLYPGTP